MMRKLTFLFIALPVAIVLIVLSVANRQSVQMSLDPFNSVDPAFAFSMPFFVFLFCAVLLGMVIGSIATWIKQGKHRKAARKEHTDAVKWQSEAESQKKRAEELAVELHPELAALPASERAA
ncbi:MAG: DUF1049 domain-containing protein [Salaquimonas sp.]